MLPASGIDITVVLAQTQPGFFLESVFNLPQTKDFVEILLRTLHFLAGIVWIGHLYFFNLVNVNLMKALDGPTKGKVIPQLMPRALVVQMGCGNYRAGGVDVLRNVHSEG